MCFILIHSEIPGRVYNQILMMISDMIFFYFVEVAVWFHYKHVLCSEVLKTFFKEMNVNTGEII